MWRNPVSLPMQIWPSAAADRRIAYDKIADWRFNQANDSDIINRDPKKIAVLDAAQLWKSDRKAGLPELLKLANLGSVWSMVLIGWSYQAGEGVAIDGVQAEYWYGRAIEGGSQEAQLRLGRIYADRLEFSRSEKIYGIGAADHFAPAMHHLASIKLRQPKTEARRREARILLEHASALGDLGAEVALASFSARGRFGLRRIPRGFWLLRVSTLKMIALSDEVAPVGHSKILVPPGREVQL